MTITEKKNEILAKIAARGWFSVGPYAEAAAILEQAGSIKASVKRSAMGTAVAVWVAA